MNIENSPETDATRLEAVAQSFEVFRAQRKHLRQPVPLALKKQAVELKAKYGHHRVCSELGTGNSTLSSWTRAVKDTASVEFIPLRTPLAPIELRVGKAQVNFDVDQVNVLADLLSPFRPKTKAVLFSRGQHPLVDQPLARPSKDLDKVHLSAAFSLINVAFRF